MLLIAEDEGAAQAVYSLRNLVTTYQYDALNRSTSVNYSNTTIGSPDVPDITRFYDGGTNGKGRFWYSYTAGNLTAGSNVEHTAIDSYDALGRPLVQRQLFKLNGSWGPTYQTSRTYNRVGGISTQTYPSGHTVAYNYDGAGRLADKDTLNLAFTGNLGDGVQRTYASGISYVSSGALKQEQFGTNTPVYNKLFYNSRLQLAQILTNTTGDDTSWNRGKIINDYSLQCSGVGCNATDNNSNLRKQQLYIPGNDQVSSSTSWYQQYDYDSLNRLKRVHEYTGNTQLDWQQEYDYDRWGNRTLNATNTWIGNAANPPNAALNEAVFDTGNLAATNRLYAPGDLALPENQRRMRYDAAGNLSVDTYTGGGERVYDAENRMTQAWANNQWQYYTYNADGQRTRRKINNQETWQIYGFDSELLAEYPANGAATTPQKEYGYRNGQLLITAEPVAAQSVTWTNVVGVSVNGNSLTKTAGTGWGNAGASSTQSIASGDGYVEVTATETTKARLFGFSHTDADQNWPSIQFGIDLDLSGSVYVFESGNNRGNFGPYATGDKLQVAIVGGVVKYKKNGTVFYTSSVTPTYPLVVDTALYENGCTLSNVVLGSGASEGAKVQWMVTDHLGTPRLILDQTGSLATVTRHDYLPFGEELFATGLRTPSLGYSNGDGIRQQFTLKERDVETGLDYFLARYHSSAQGRFTSPDLYNAIVDSEEEEDFAQYLGQPQNWNRYVYVWNNPLRYIDPNGEKVYVVTYTFGNSSGDDEFRRAAETREQQIRNSKGFDPKKDTVLLAGVKTKEDFANIIKEANGLQKQYGKVEQISLYSHAGRQDGPVFHDQGGNPTQFSQRELSNLGLTGQAVQRQDSMDAIPE